MKFEVYDYSWEKLRYLKNDINQNILVISPKYIKWNFNNQNFIINTKDPSANFVLIGEDYLILQYREKSEEYPYPRNMVIYNFNAVVEHVVEVPFLKTPEVAFNHQNLQASFDGFMRLDRKDDTSPYEILIDNQRHVLVSLYDEKHGDSFDDRAGKPHELQALNVETGKFHPTWCKYYGRM